MPRHAHWWSICLIATTSPVFADDDPKTQLQEFAASVAQATNEGMFGNNAFFVEPAMCDKAVRAGNAAGLKPTDTFQGGDGSTILWRRAPEICAQYGRLHQLAKLIDDLRDSWNSIAAFEATNRPDGSPDPSVKGAAYRVSVEQAQRCVRLIDAAIPKGVPVDVKFAPTGNERETKYTLTEMKTKCADWVRFGTGAAKADDQRAAAELAAAKAKWGKLGITGDRLTYLIKNGHNPIFGRGCVQLAGTTYKTSQAFYEIGQDDLAWIVYKTAFSGDKQVSYTSRRYPKRGNWSCQ